MTQHPLFPEHPATEVTLELLDKWIRDCDSLDQRWAEIQERLRRLSEHSLFPQSEDTRKEVDASIPDD